MDTNSRECKVIIDNDVHSSTGNSSKLEMIEIDMYPVSHTNRGEKLGEFMFEVNKQHPSLVSRMFNCLIVVQFPITSARNTFKHMGAH